MSTIALTLWLATGCATVGSFQRAETLGAGNTEWAAELGGWSVIGTEGIEVVPHATGAFRYGISDGADVGFHVGTGSLSGDVKVAFTPRAGPVRVSLAPSIGISGYSNGHLGGTIFAAQIPLLIGISTGPASELVLVPKTHVWGDDVRGCLVSVGASVSYVFPLARTVSLVPEWTLLVPAVGSIRAMAQPYTEGKGVAIMQGGIGLLIGKHSGREPALGRQ